MRTRSLLGSLLTCALLAAAAGSAQGSTWTALKLRDNGVRTVWLGVSCPTASFCVAVGGNHAVASSANPAGGSDAWNVVYPGGSVDPSGFPPGGLVHVGSQIKGVSCPTAGFCAAAGFEGELYSSSDPSGPASAWKIVPLQDEGEARIHMTGISCPSPRFCVAVAYGGKVITSTKPSGDRPDWTVTELSQPFDLRGVACPSASLCVAVGNEGSVVASTDPSAGPSAWRSAGAPAGGNSLNAVSCPTMSLCVTGNASQVITSADPAGGPAAWKVADAGTGLPAKGVSCPSVSACAIVDNNADVNISTDPTGGRGAWRFKNVLPFNWQGPREGSGPGEGNGMFGLSCPLTSLCVGVGQDQQVIVSSDPFSPDVQRATVRGKTKRPRVAITRHPAKRLDRRRGGVGVTFGFRAKGEAMGFRCKTHGRRFRPCGSPKRYRVGRGKHVFRVRAIAPGGAAGPVTSFHFRVGALSEQPPVGSCPAKRLASPSGPFNPCVNS